jgi:hypothetical protein
VDAEAFCDAWLAAWTGGDVERLAAYYADDCVYSDPSKPKGVRGKDELRRYLAKWLPDYAQMVWTREGLFPIDGGFCVTWTARIPVRGEWLIERGMDLVLLDASGKVLRNEVYFDMSSWRTRLESPP